jgi:anti-anti-sigma factor
MLVDDAMPSQTHDRGHCVLLLTLEPASDERVRIRCHGEIDLSTAEQLDLEVRRAAASGARTVTIDLTAVEFIDCSGLRVLLELDALGREEGWRLELAYTEGVVARLLELTRSSTRFGRAR